MWFATYLYQHGLVSAIQILEASVRQIEQRTPIGRLALEYRKMTGEQVAKVLSAQVDQDEHFGRAAIRLGFLSEEDFGHLLLVQAERMKPLHEILVEIGAIERDVMEREYRSARRNVTDPDEHLTMVAHAL